MRLPRPPRALLGTLVVVLGLWGLAWELLEGRKPLDGFRLEFLYGLAPAEGTFYAAGFAVEALIVVWGTLEVANRWGPGWETRLREIVDDPRRTRWSFAILASLLALLVALVVVHRTPLNEDEKTYLFQAKLLLLGKLGVDVPPEAAAFRQPFVVGGSTHWSGQYFWAQPAMLAAGMRLGLPWIANAIETGVTVFFTSLLVEEVTADRRMTALATVLVALSPQMVLTGGTLHSSSLSAAAGVVSVWAVVRLSRASSAIATLALALSTSVALHNRPFDHAALLVGVAVSIGASRPRDIGRIALRLLPAVALTLPAIALHAFINKAVSGNYLHSGYWMFNEGKGDQTMGFGRGPFGSLHTPATAATKTLTNFVRVAFFSTGDPICALILVAVLLAPSRPRRLLLAPLGPFLVYFTAYFFYAGSPIYPGGPVFYTALTPIVVAWIAAAFVSIHDGLSARGLVRAVPAFIVAHMAAAVVVFWPPELAELRSQADDAGSCEDLVRDVGVDNALVFVGPGYNFMRQLQVSWTNWPPLPSPNFDDPVLFPRQGTLEEDAAVVRRFGQGRKVRLALCTLVSHPAIYEYDPVHGRVPDVGPIVDFVTWDRTIRLFPRASSSSPPPPPLASAAPPGR